MQKNMISTKGILINLVKSWHIRFSTAQPETLLSDFKLGDTSCMESGIFHSTEPYAFPPSSPSLT